MNYRLVINYIGWFLFYYSFVFFILLVPAVVYKENELISVGLETFFCVLCLGGLAIILTTRGEKKENDNFFTRDSLATVGLVWIAVTILGGLPFFFAGKLSFIDSVFESISGFTTTGATVVNDIESFPKTLLFWRALTHFIGGIGIVVIFMSVLPYLGAGGRLLMESESFAPDMKFIKPRVREAVKQILLVYVSLTLMQCILLIIFGMNVFDAICHSFATLGTGGFSTRQMSIESYNSIPIEIITIFFMLCGATSFALMYQLYIGNVWNFLKNTEWRVYIGIWGISIIIVTLSLIGINGHFSLDKTQFPIYSFGKALRYASFTVTSLFTSTGFTNTEYDTWPYIAKWYMMVIVIIGGCAGSTCGGIKVIRFVILCKFLLNRIYATFQPRVVKSIKVGEQVITEDIQKAVLGFFGLWMVIIGISSIVLCWTGLPIVTSVSAVLVSFGNVGPGLEYIGGYENYSSIPEIAKVVLSVLMLMGRLEIYSVLVLFFPSFWRSK